MNRRMVVYMLGQIVKLEAALLVLPLVVSLLYRESCALHFAMWRQERWWWASP